MIQLVCNLPANKKDLFGSKNSDNYSVHVKVSVGEYPLHIIAEF
jgi:hypothetical protein